MAKLTFCADDVRKMLEHARACNSHKPTMGQQFDALGDKAFDMKYDDIVEAMPDVGPGLWLVKDSGIYLMSNGNPGQPEDPAKPEGKLLVAYAEGYEAGSPDEWERSRAAVGGDDFSEALMDAEIWSKLLTPQTEKVIIRVNKRTLGFATIERKD